MKDVTQTVGGSSLGTAPFGWLRRSLRRSLRRQREGFTLLELLVVIAIIGILASAALPRFDAFRAAAYDARAQQDLRNLASAQELYRATHEDYAAALEDVVAYSASEGVTVAIESASATGFTAVSRHEAGSQRFAWDSDAQPPLTATAD